MRAVIFREYGPPDKVLQLGEVEVPATQPGQVRVKVLACALNPADWALCDGLFGTALPRGIGCDVSGTIDELPTDLIEKGELKIGDLVFGPTAYAANSSAGAAEYAILTHWARVPSGLNAEEAAAMVMVTETAFRSLEALQPVKDQTILIHGAGTMVGFAAAQMALLRGCKVIATMGATFAEELSGKGAKVTSYGDGLVSRIKELRGGKVDMVFDAAPAPNKLTELIEVAGGDPQKILTCSNCDKAEEFGVRDSLKQKVPLQYAVLQEFGDLAAEGRYRIPIGGRYSLDQWKEAVAQSQKRPKGKVLIVPGW